MNTELLTEVDALLDGADLAPADTPDMLPVFEGGGGGNGGGC
ncbi:hypothetical protein SAMN04488564_13016 [Lentzea waywayandensis]|uniref:Uncharacterized protein n=1 Tax=Lentzea waywayandensis TaxID=84724 RepID=A0A1I6FK39_9PSEU|nr:hypothetical protein [Lentzea waywayandensis]SFR30167.1 hypothetical protein SAMN04488564_13016 [Lentzea waywayandensis]